MSISSTCGWRTALGVFALVCAAGCGPAQDTDRALRTALGAEPLPAPPASEVPLQEVLAMVQEQPAPDGEGTVVDWIERRTRSTRGQPLFPRWSVQRRAASRFEVKYTYTWVSLDNQIEGRGFIWHVDAALNKVQGPKPIAQSELPRARSVAEQQQRRAEDPEYSLR